MSMDLHIQQDGLTYVIDLTRAGSGETLSVLLREDSDGWYMQECTTGRAAQDWWRIGRRKTWQKALQHALVLMEQVLEAREKVAA